MVATYPAETSPRASMTTAAVALQMAAKRNRVLTRQPRVKRDSDSASTNQVSPEPPTGLEFDPFPAASSAASSVHASHLHHHHLLTVPPRIERHSSEPAPSLAPSSPHLLSVPPGMPFLIKQHSDPLLPSQHISSSNSFAAGSSGTNPFAPLHRQYSHPLSGSSSSHVTIAPLQHPHHISLPDSIYASGSPPPAGSSQYLVPQHQAVASSSSTSVSSETSGGGGGGGGTTTTTTTTGSSNPTKVSNLPQFTATYMSESGRTISPVAATAAERSASESDARPSHKLRSSKSSSGFLLSERSGGLHARDLSGVFEYLGPSRAKNEELQRSVSSPQTSRELITKENPRSSHCPVIRPGPALGCNFCWNTIDGHNRILRRKTKYHCPECQTNLCIVPCFQEYHERLNSEAAAGSSSSNNDNNKSFAGASGSGSNAARHFTKTESI